MHRNDTGPLVSDLVGSVRRKYPVMGKPLGRGGGGSTERSHRPSGFLEQVLPVHIM